MDEISYSLSPRRRVVILSVAGFFLALPLLLLVGWYFSGEQALALAAGIVACIMLPFFIYMCVCAYYPRLSVCADGLMVRGVIGFAPINIAWESIERLRLNCGSEALVLRQPLQSRAARFWGNWSGTSYSGSPLYDQEQQELIRAARYVPLQAFAWWFEHGDLLTNMRSHAPALFENFDREISAAKLARASNRRMIIGISVLTVACLAVAVYFGIYHPDALENPSVTSFGNKVLTVAGYLVAVVLGLYAVANILAVFQFAKARKFGMAAFWLVAAVVQFLLAILALARSSGY